MKNRKVISKIWMATTVLMLVIAEAVMAQVAEPVRIFSTPGSHTLLINYPAQIEVYAVGAGGGGQGGHNVDSRCGTGGGGGGGAAAYMKFNLSGETRFDINVGAGGTAGISRSNLSGGNYGNDGGATSVSWGSGNTLIVAGGKGGGTSNRNGGSGGSVSTKPTTIADNVEHWRTVAGNPGGDGIDGDNGIKHGKGTINNGYGVGGNTATLKNIGSFSAITGGVGGHNQYFLVNCSWYWVVSPGPGTGAGGSGGYGHDSADNDQDIWRRGGDGEVRVVITRLHSVTFDANGGLFEVAPGINLKTLTVQNILNGKQVGILSPQRAGYTFAGWWIAQTGGTQWDLTTNTVTATTTLWARWAQITYTVSFNSNGGTPTPSSQTIAHGAKVTLPPSPTRTGHTFAGWWTAPTDGTQWNFTNNIVTATTTLWARWTRSVYTVTFNPDGGLPAPSPQTVAHGITAARPTDPTKTGYIFAGWWTEQAGGFQWNFITNTIIATTTLWARWSQIYSIIYSGFTESETSEWPTSYTVEDLPLTLPTPTKNDGSIFGGWYEGDNPDNLVALIPLGSTGSKEYSALWGVGVLVTEQVIPDNRPGDELLAVVPIGSLPTGFTAGPNPIARLSGVVNFFRHGRRINDGTLTIYDATGNFVKKINASDKSADNSGNRIVGSWDLTDVLGRPVPGGTYLIHGVVTTVSGSRERVSVIIGVR